MSTFAVMTEAVSGGTLRPRHGHRQNLLHRGHLVEAVILGVLALIIRLAGLGSANELFIDEITYASLARQLAEGKIPSTGGGPFFLHPPASFALNALATVLFGLDGDAMDLALKLRPVNAILGSLTVVVCYLLVRRLAGRLPGTIAALVLVTDPFVLRMDGRVMIETPAGLAVVTGWLLLLRSLDGEPGNARARRELAAGLVFGLALITKDMTAAFIVVPLLASVFWRKTLPAKTVRRVLVVAAVPYLVYLALITVWGLASDLADQKLTGVLRMVGVMQETGFNAAPDADLAARLVEMVGRFGTSYLLLGLCPLAGLIAAGSADPRRRLIGLLALSSGLLGAYSVLGGAAEEQFGYYVVLAAVVATPVALLEVVRRRTSLRRPLAAGAMVVCLVSLLLGVQARATVDDGLVRARAWMATELPEGARVGLTSVTGEFALLPHKDWEVLPSLSSLRSGGAQYVLTQSHPLSRGYGYAAPELLDWMERHAKRIFTATGPSAGDTVVWQLDQATLDAAVVSGLTLPPVSGGYP
jgi:4-amino-4-deoxy-L-arabinose transferase-like glycosyltransferase